MARVTVLFATLNGAHTLPRMLDTLERLVPPSDGWRVVAVDNGSTDGSLHLLEQRSAKLPMSVVTEPRRGKNIALNAGLALADGDIVALTDDDTILPVDWLISIEKIATQRAEYDIFGGPIYPIWEEHPPAWVLQCVPKYLFGLTEFPEGPINPESIWGGNMAARAAVFREHNFSEGFDMNSETEFTSRAHRSGYSCWHFHASPVGHIIRPYQFEPEWHMQRAYRHGRADYRMSHINNEDTLALRSLYPALTLIKGACHIGRAVCNYASSHLLGDTDDQFKAGLRLRYWRGNLAERYTIAARLLAAGNNKLKNPKSPSRCAL